MGLLIIFVWKKLQKKGGNNFKKKLSKRENFLPTGGGGRGWAFTISSSSYFWFSIFTNPILEQQSGG